MSLAITLGVRVSKTFSVSRSRSPILSPPAPLRVWGSPPRACLPREPRPTQLCSNFLSHITNPPLRKPPGQSDLADMHIPFCDRRNALTSKQNARYHPFGTILLGLLARSEEKEAIFNYFFARGERDGRPIFDSLATQARTTRTRSTRSTHNYSQFHISLLILFKFPLFRR